MNKNTIWKRGDLVTFRCRGCDSTHSLSLDGPGPVWAWNGDMEKPTFSPSILVTGVRPLTKKQIEDWNLGLPLPVPTPMTCHSFVKNGEIEYLSDCSHELAGRTVSLPVFDKD